MLKNLRVVCAAILSFSIVASAKDLPAVPQVANQVPINVATKKISKSIEFRKLSSLLNATDSAGKASYGGFCNDEKEIFFQPQYNRVLIEIVGNLFKAELRKYGYPEYSPGESLFEDKIGVEADFVAGATLQDLKYDLCWKGHSRGLGKAYAKMKWEVYSNQLQKVVYSKVVEASIDNSKEDPISDLEIDKKLFSVAVDNLISDQKFVDIFVSGVNVPVASAELAPLSIASAAKAPGNAVAAQKELVASVVTVESGVVTGNGFFISADGYILTNQNVVGNAKFVKVIQSNRRTLVGEVVRIDTARNVALIKTDATPSAVLAVRLSPVEVGEEVFSIGSPLGKALAGTFTRGILSSKRSEGGLSYLQSDVAVTEYSEGAPLVDKQGAVVGISQSGLHSKSLNFFTPISEAVDKLALTLVQPPIVPAK